ncbi:baseplate J/gp47 family protein [Mesorhizobium sp. ANAO-SY3R2]|uniref:baseplate J/gp47 family protein n=1 Tax=Mesorhizobium sp. ANAO-SY3R2 TaxID=3166644 RepID=UPI0036700030
MADLPKPAIIEELVYEALLDLRVDKTQELFAAKGIDYDVGNLETDPVKIQIEENAYREVLVRRRINDAVLANILAFAIDVALDHLAGFYDVVRMPGEKDDRLRQRVRLAIQGRSTGGTEPRYRGIAMAVDLRVRDTSIYTIGRSPIIYAAVFSTDNNGVADPDLIARVAAALNDPEKRMVNDTIVVEPAARIVVNPTADVWLLPDANADVLTKIGPAVKAAWQEIMALGRDLPNAWLTAMMMIPGVQRVEVPTPDTIASFREAIAIGTVSVTFKGRSY